MEHFGLTLISVSSTPSKVSAYASRNQDDDRTQIIAVNWNDVPAVLTFKVDDLATTPKPATFTLPALSVGAIEIPDTGAASALVYGETQHKANLTPAAIVESVVALNLNVTVLFCVPCPGPLIPQRFPCAAISAGSSLPPCFFRC